MMNQIKKNCTHCLFEYTCSWEPAGKKSSCPAWRAEGRNDEKDKNISVSAYRDADPRVR